MAVYDRWHVSKPKAGARPCEHRDRTRGQLYPSKAHGEGKRWQVRWYDEDGKQCKLNFDKKAGSNPEIHADALDAKLQSELNTGSYIDPAAGQVLLEDYAKDWFSGQVGPPNSLRIVRYRLAHIYDVEEGPRSRRPKGSSPIGKVPMAALAKRPSLIQKWMKSLEAKGLSDNYVLQIAGTLSSIFIAAMDDGIVARNPLQARSLNKPEAPKARARRLTRQQVAAAAEALQERDRLAVWLGTAAGMRQGEIFGVAEEDVEFLGRDRQIHIVRQVDLVEVQQPDGTFKAVPVFKPPKRGKERDVPLADELGLKIAAHIKAHPPREVTLPWLLPDGKPVTARLLVSLPGGLPHTDQQFKYDWERVRKALNLPPHRDYGMQIMRHTFASVQLAAGVDIRKLALWLGHEDPGFTLRTYTHFMPDVEDRGRRATDAFLRDEDGASALDVPLEGER